MSPSRRSLVGALALLFLAGCSGAPASEETASSKAYPFTVDNCGVEVTVDRAPERIVTIKSSSTELALALGLGDRLVGTAFADGPIPKDLAAKAEGISVLSDQLPSSEAVLDTEPNLVYAGWESNFSADGAGERDKLQKLGVSTYVSPSACKGKGYKPAKLTYDLLFEEITEAGRVLGAPDAARDLVAAQKKDLAAVKSVEGDVSALWYSSGTDIPYVGAGTGAPAMVMDKAGLANVAADVKDTWTPLSWEAIADRNPDVIILVDATWNPAADKKKMLAANPITSKLDAVRNQRYVVVPFPASEAGVRSVSAARDIAAQVNDLGLAGF